MRLASVGVDISKAWFDAAASELRLKQRFDYTQQGLNRFLKLLNKHGKVRVCMEATGLYYEPLAELLHAAGHEVVVVNPQCIKSFARSELRRSKSDPLDAVLIQQYCQEKYDRLHLWQPMQPQMKRLREILRRRAALVEQRTAEKNRIKAGFSSREVLTSLEETIKFIDTQIKQLERAAFGIIETDKELERLVNLIETLPGVGKLTAATILVEVPQCLWTGRLAAVFAGVIPSKNSSGTSTSASYLSKVGSARVRHALYMPALSAASCNPVLKTFYERLLGRGLKKKQAITAVMRKLLHLIFGIVSTGQPFDPEYESKRKALKKAV